MPSITTTASGVGALAVNGTISLATRIASLLNLAECQTVARSDEMDLATEREASHADAEIIRLNRERAMVAAENQLLKEIISLSGPAAATPLLRRLVPHASSGRAALIAVASNEQWTVGSRGFAKSSIESLNLSEELLEQIQNETLISTDNRLAARLSIGVDPRDLAATQPLYLLAIRDRDSSELTAVLLTTSLWPIGAPPQEQLTIVKRAAQAAVRLCLQDRRLRCHADELRLTREMLSLRSLADHAIERPLEMIGQFASRLCRLVEMDRATVFLVARRSGDVSRPLVEAGRPLPATVVASWQKHESQLAKFAMSRTSGCVLDQKQLADLGIQNLLGSAAAWPLVSGDRLLGAIILSRQSQLAVPLDRERLLEWSVELLTQTLRRTYDDAAIRRQARHDGLTDLANRRTFDTLLAGETDRVRLGLSEDCSLLLLDLDRFKSVNDQYGHQAGDEVLRVTAQLLREHVGRMRAGERSVLARYGGEELAVLLPGVGISGALRLAEQIRAAIERRVIAFDNHLLRITASIGVASCPRHGLSPAELIGAADGGLYRAKSEGRNRVGRPVDSAK